MDNFFYNLGILFLRIPKQKERELYSHEIRVQRKENLSWIVVLVIINEISSVLGIKWLIKRKSLLKRCKKNCIPIFSIR